VAHISDACHAVGKLDDEPYGTLDLAVVGKCIEGGKLLRCTSTRMASASPIPFHSSCCSCRRRHTVSHTAARRSSHAWTAAPTSSSGGSRNVDPAGYGRDELPSDLATPVIFYCSGPGCGAAHYAARRAVRMGFSHVHVMTDGIAGWSAQGQLVEAASDMDGRSWSFGR
jgi:rhodanese-related sulfurtransferase